MYIFYFCVSFPYKSFKHVLKTSISYQYQREIVVFQSSLGTIYPS